MFTLLLQNLTSGILVGCVYGLVAVGLSLLFGVMKFVNFSHGAVMMLSMYLMLILYKSLHVDPYLGIVFVIPFSFLLGYVLAFFSETIVVRERTLQSHVTLLLTLGFSLILTNSAQIIFGPGFHNITSCLTGKVIDLNGIIVSWGKLIAAFVTLVVYGFLFIFLKYTDLGKAIRAVSQDMDSAVLVGISVKHIFRVGFGISSSIVGIAGLVILPFYTINPTVGDIFQLKAFIIVILGGLGSIVGTLIGGLIIGIIEALGATVFNASYAQMCIFVVFLLFLLLKPSGLLGKS